MIQNFFKKRQLPQQLPEEIKLIIEEVKKAQSKEEALKLSYDLLSEKYRGSRWGTYLNVHKLFRADIGKICANPGVYQCTTLNYLMRLVFVGSGFFKDPDIEQRKSLVWFVSPHQYLRVKISDKRYINVDLWGARYGINFGDYARGLHSGFIFNRKSGKGL